jgi:hypothetical protein
MSIALRERRGPCVQERGGEALAVRRGYQPEFLSELFHLPPNFFPLIVQPVCAVKFGGDVPEDARDFVVAAASALFFV